MLTSELFDEITNDPASLGYGGKEASEIASLLNDKTITQRRLQEKYVVNNFIAAHNLNVKMHGVTLLPPDPNGVDKPIPEASGLTVRLAALAGLDWLKTNTGPHVDPAHPNINGLVGLMQGAGVFTADEVTAFWQLFEVSISRAEELWGDGTTITEQQVSAALLYPRWQTEHAAYEAARGTADTHEQRMMSLANGIDPDESN